MGWPTYLTTAFEFLKTRPVRTFMEERALKGALQTTGRWAAREGLAKKAPGVVAHFGVEHAAKHPFLSMATLYGIGKKIFGIGDDKHNDDDQENVDPTQGDRYAPPQEQPVDLSGGQAAPGGGQPN